MDYTSKGLLKPVGSEFFTIDHANQNAQKADDLIVALEKRPILNKVAAYTVVTDDLNKTITVTGDTTITLTAIATLGLGFRCRISNIGLGIVSVVPSGTDTIAKGTGITIYPGKCVEVVADYAGMWTVVGFDFTEQINTLDALKATKTELSTEEAERLAEIEVERQRINSFTTLAAGSTTGDAELIDARVGADGIVYANAGGAIRGQHTKLKENLTEIDSLTEYAYSGGVNLHDETKDISGYITSNGSITNSSLWKTTDYIEVKLNTYLYTYTSSASSTIWYRAIFDANKNVLDYQASASDNIRITQSTAKYIRISHENISGLRISEDCIDKTDGTLRTKYRVLSDNASEKITAITKNIGKNLLNMSEITKGAYPDSTRSGALHFSASWVSTPYIEVESGETIYASKYNGSTLTGLSMWYCCGYDSDKTFVSVLANGASNVEIPSGIKYIRFCNDTIDLSTEKIQVEYGSMTAYEDYTITYSISASTDLVWKGKKWVCVGDSLTEVNSKTSMHYHDYVAKNTGITIVNMGASGTGYARGDSYNFYTRINNVPTDVDVVTIFGSGNDIGSGLPIGNPTDNDTTTICGYINLTIDRLIARIPTVSLGIVSPTPWTGYPPYISGNMMELYSQALENICKNRSIPFLDLYHCSNLRPWTEEGRIACYSHDGGDGTHPDENGHKLIAPRFKVFLENLLL